jgi:outer membrane protein assembly factor BamB/predicted transcriptional regulator
MKRSERLLIQLMMVLISVALLTPGLQGAQGQSDYRPWPMMNGNTQRTGLSPFDTSNNTGQLKWRFGIDNQIISSPVIGSNDIIYFQTEYNIYAITYKGELIWQQKLRGSSSTSPVIVENGTIYCVDSWGVYALDPEGSLIWRLELRTGQVYSSPAIGKDGTIYFGADDHNLYAITPKGQIKWKFYLEEQIQVSPSIGPDGTIYIGSDSNYLYAVRPTGKLKWKFDTGGVVRTNPLIESNGRIYVTGTSGKLYALTPDGTKKWTFTTGEDGPANSPALGPAHEIYFTAGRMVYAVSQDGKLIWKCPLDNVWALDYTAPAVGHDGTIYLADYKGYFNDTGTPWNSLFAIDQNGTMKWKYLMPGAGLKSTPAIGSDGTVYIGSGGSEKDDADCQYCLYAIGNNFSIFQPPPAPVQPSDDKNDTPPDAQNGTSPPPSQPPLTPTPEKITPLRTKVEADRSGTLVACISIMILGAVLTASEVGQFSVYSFSSMLYSKRKKEEILDNFIRGQLYGRISENPGLSLTELSEKVNRPTGTIVYHLRTLENEGLIKSQRRGLNRLFFSSSVKVKEGFFELKPLQRMLLSLVEKNPGISQQKLSELTEVSPATINRHIHELVERALVKITKGSSTQCYIVK